MLCYSGNFHYFVNKKATIYQGNFTMRLSPIIILVTLLGCAVSIHAQPDSLWSYTYGGEVREYCYSIIQTADGGFALAGWTWSFGAGNYDFWLVRTDANGDSLWSRSFGGRSVEWCNSIIGTADGGFALSGYTWSFGAGGYDFWLVRTDENGDSLWSRTFGGRDWDNCYALIQVADGGFALAGITNSFGAGGYDFWLVRTDENGDSLWSRTFGGGNDEWCCYSLIQTADGGFALAGRTGSFGAGEEDFWLVRTDENGDSLWSRTFGGDARDACCSLIQTADGGFALAGGTDSFGVGFYDFWLVKTGPDPVSAPPEPFIPHPSSFILLEAFPNPFNAVINLEYNIPSASSLVISVSDLTGKEIARLTEGVSPAGHYRSSWNAGELPSGTYFLRMEDGTCNSVRAIQLLR